MFAQPYGKTSYETLIETADQYLADGDYYQALETFKEAYDQERTLDVGLVITQLEYRLKNYARAERGYKNLLKRDKNNQLIPERLEYANTLKALGKYELAIEQYLTYLELEEDESKKPFVYNELKGIKLLEEIPDNLEAVIKPLDKNVNSASQEYSPAIYNDGSLYFASLQRSDIVELNGEEGDYFVKVYSTTLSEKEDRKGNKNYNKPKALGDAVNRAGYQTANVSFSKDGREMFFTRATLLGNDISTSEIYISNGGGGSWSPGRAVEGVNGDYIATHPMPGELFGNEVLFFTANMPGGYGGYDLYYATKTGDGVYSTPNNLGDKINTVGDESFPFYKDGTLYFSTNGHPTIGGYDIYYANWDGAEWIDISNMGNNYNTSFDDTAFRMNQSGTKGFLVSNRPYKKKRKLKSETCCDDIFSVEIREIVIDLLALIQNEAGPLEGATAEVYDLDSDEYPQTKSEPNASDYNFILDSDRTYKLKVFKDGYFPDSLEFNTAGILDDYTVEKTITLRAKPVEKTDEPPKEDLELVSINQPIRLNNIYYDFDDDKILSDAEKDLNLLYDLLQEYPDMVIELSSHTDAQGADEYNEALSQRRADSARRWLLNKGVAPARIVPKGYGETLIQNECVNGVECDDDRHRQNRRTEFKIIAGPQFITIKKNRGTAAPHNGGSRSFGLIENKWNHFEKQISDPKPIISFTKNNIELGQIKKGETREITYEFVNTGNADLAIELVTACKCTELDWTQEIVKPGEKGTIRAVFDSTDVALGELKKTIDIIANTDPIVVEAFFIAEIIE